MKEHGHDKGGFGCYVPNAEPKDLYKRMISQDIVDESLIPILKRYVETENPLVTDQELCDHIVNTTQRFLQLWLKARYS